MQSLLIVIIIAAAGISGAWTAAAQQQPCPTDNVFGNISARMNPAIAAQRDFDRAVCEYRNCLAANANNANACEGQRHIMDARGSGGPLQWLEIECCWMPDTRDDEERQRQEQNAKRERELREIPPQEIDESK
jgi:hypothetical protein